MVCESTFLKAAFSACAQACIHNHYIYFVFLFEVIKVHAENYLPGCCAEYLFSNELVECASALCLKPPKDFFFVDEAVKRPVLDD